MVWGWCEGGVRVGGWVGLLEGRHSRQQIRRVLATFGGAVAASRWTDQADHAEAIIRLTRTDMFTLGVKRTPAPERCAPDYPMPWVVRSQLPLERGGEEEKKCTCKYMNLSRVVGRLFYALPCETRKLARIFVNRSSDTRGVGGGGWPVVPHQLRKEGWIIKTTSARRQKNADGLPRQPYLKKFIPCINIYWKWSRTH